MDTHFKIKAEAHPTNRGITLWLNGKFSEDALPTLDQSVWEARVSHESVSLDLSEVTLVDRKAVQYFSNQMSEGVKLLNCPGYLRRWIPQVRIDETES